MYFNFYNSGSSLIKMEPMSPDNDVMPEENEYEMNYDIDQFE